MPEAKMSGFGYYDPIQPDYDQAWVVGEEHVGQDGTYFWKRLREEQGWSQEDVYALTGFMLSPPEQMMIESAYQPGYVGDVRQLVMLAVIYGRKPGELLDECFEDAGREIIAERKVDDAS